MRIMNHANNHLSFVGYCDTGHTKWHSMHKVGRSIDRVDIWTPVDDFDGDLVGAMASYYKLFALGLGDDTNFTAWVEPYEFFSAKKMGTTNSAPVFDRSVDPPLFLGVVANDVYLDAFEQVLGEDAQSSTMLQRFVRLSTAKCPNIDLSDCQLEFLRYLAGGGDATCGTCYSTEYPGIVPTECPFKPDLPKNLWQNTDMEGLEYKDRACCEIGTSYPSETCGINLPEEIDTVRIAIIVGSVLATLCGLCCCGWIIFKCCKQMATSSTKNVTLVPLPSAAAPAPAPVQVPTAAMPTTTALPVGSVVSPSFVMPANNGQVTYGGASVMMSPSAPPPMNPVFHVRTR